MGSTLRPRIGIINVSRPANHKGSKKYLPMRTIFISYRRDDTEGQAGRLFQDLSETFGSDLVFMDVADIDPGIDFRRAIEKQTASCRVLLALIGRDWLTISNADGKRRLDDPNDVVRFETSSALRRDILVIPVLVQGARMPRAEELPDDLKDLAYRNAVEITHARWDSDVQLLIKALRPYVPVATKAATKSVPSPAGATAPRRKRGVPFLAVVTLLALGGWMAYDPKQSYRQLAAGIAAVQKVAMERSSATRTEGARSVTPDRAERSADRLSAERAADARAAQIRQHRDGACMQGFVWREARGGDKVCVSPEVRTQTARENRLADANQQPGGAYGANTCKAGFVWREAFANDFVCVPPASRIQAAADNASAPHRVVPLPR